MAEWETSRAASTTSQWPRFQFSKGGAVAVPQVSSGSAKTHKFLHRILIPSVRAGCRQVIEVFGDYSRELLKAI